MKRLCIVIDGPAGAGKSTVAKKTAASLGYIYIDTGAMYRGVTSQLLADGVDISDAAAVAAAVENWEITIVPGLDEAEPRVLINGRDVTSALRRPEVSRAVPQVAAIPAVRAKLVKEQRRLGQEGGIVMDGRDIGTEVLPFAEVKIFLTASLEERARRRQAELAQKGYQIDLAAARKEIAARDHADTNRPVSPLRRPADALVIDSTAMSVEAVVTRILDYYKTRTTNT